MHIHPPHPNLPWIINTLISNSIAFRLVRKILHSLFFFTFCLIFHFSGHDIPDDSWTSGFLPPPPIVANTQLCLEPDLIRPQEK